MARRVAASLIAGAALLSTSAARADEGDRILAESLAKAKALAAEMPKPAELGERWVYPWQVPAGAGSSALVASEQAWWTLFERRFPAGVPVAHAKAMADQAAASAAQMQQEGFGPREGLIHLRSAIRAQVTSAAQKAQDGAALLTAMVTAVPAGGASGARAESGAVQMAMMKAMNARYDGLDLEALKAGFVADATLLAQSTRMEYWCSNDWEKAKSGKQGPGDWTGFVSVTYSLVSEGRSADVPDLKEADAPALEKTVNEAYALMHARIAPKLQAEAKRRIARVDEEIARGGDPARRASLDKERAAAQGELDALAKPIAIKVLHRKFGDNSYVMRLSAKPPDGSASNAALYTGWLRNGPALVEITFGGTFPDAEMDKQMDHFLVVMDGKTELHR